MEYLMTYGWAILIIAVVLGALFQLGVFNSSSFSPRAPPGACQVFRPSGPGTTTNINLMGVCTGQLPQYVAQFNGQSSYMVTSSMIPLSGNLTFSTWAKTNFAWGEGVERIMLSWVPADGKYILIEKEIAANLGLTVVGSIAWKVAGITSQPAQWGDWMSLVGTYDGTTLKFYLNGILVATQTGSGAVSDSSLLYVGDWQSGSGSYFKGSLANVQIYNTSLSANQIQALYLEGIGGAPMKLQNLVGWWPLNGNSNDYSGNNNNGVPTAVTFTSQYGK